MNRPKVSIPAGDSRIIEAKLVDEVTNSIVSLAGATIEWRLGRKPDDATPLLTKTIGAGITVPAPETGVFRIKIDPVDSERAAGEYFHQVRVVFPDSSRATVLSDYLTITETL